MKRAAFSLLLLLALVGCTGAKVSTDYDHEASFSKYKTYAWLKGGEAANPMVEQRIRTAIDSQLAAKGLTKVTDSPDLHVATYVSLDLAQQVNIDTYGYGDWGGRGSHMVSAAPVDVGTLMVDLVDTSSEKLLWRGIATNIVNSKVSQEMVDKVAAKMFARYPPKP